MILYKHLKFTFYIQNNKSKEKEKLDQLLYHQSGGCQHHHARRKRAIVCDE